jgi:serine/threonine protein kinase
MEVVSTLGIGTYGSVYRVSHNNKNGALKVMQRSTGSFSGFIRTTLRELWLGRNFVPYTGTITSPTGTFFAGLQPLGICSLADVTPLTLSQLRLVGHQIAVQLQAIHSDGIIHHDVKPQNIILYNESTARLVDFSLSMRVGQSYDADVVTMWWRAPEILMGIPHNNKSDVWSLGVILLNAINIKPLIIADVRATSEEMLKKLVSVFGTRNFGILEKRFAIKSSRTAPICKCDEDLNGLLERMLEMDPEKRASMKEVLKHSFWTGPRENLSNLGSCEYPVKLDACTRQSIETSYVAPIQPMTQNNGASLIDRIEAFELFVDAAVFFNMNLSVILSALYIWDTLSLSSAEAIRASFFAASCIDTDKDIGIADACERIDYTSQTCSNEAVVRAIVYSIPGSCGLCPVAHLHWLERDRSRIWMFVSSASTWASAEAKEAWCGKIIGTSWTPLFKALLSHCKFSEGSARYDLYLL